MVDAILGGWSISEIYTFNSGVFLRFGAAPVSGNPAIDNPSRARMFDTSKFTRQPAFTRRTNPLQFPEVTGPGYKNLDLTLAKTYLEADEDAGAKELGVIRMSHQRENPVGHDKNASARSG